MATSRRKKTDAPKLFLPTPEDPSVLVESKADPEIAGLPDLNMADLGVKWNTMKTKAEGAILALSKFTKVENDEEDEKLAKELIVARNTAELVSAERKSITVQLDNAKKALMQPEKDISVEYNRGRSLRDAYLNEKLRKQEEERKEIERKKNHDQEIIRVTAAFDTAVVDGLVNCVNQMNVAIKSYVATMNLNNWDEKKKKFDFPPKLNPDKYHDLFLGVRFNPEWISNDEYKAIAAEAKEKWTYEKCNNQYSKSGMGVLKMWKDDLPRLKQQMIDGESAEKIRQEADMRATAGTSELRQQSEAIAREAKSTILDAEFSAQMELQDNTGNEVKNVRQDRVAWLGVSEPARVADTLSGLVVAVLGHPKFKGLYARDRNGNIKDAIDGVPQYNAWIQPLLDFAAENIESFNGIQYKTVAKTIQKA